MQDSALGRAIGSIAVIIWSVFLFVVFNFFSDYIAFYNSTSQGGVTQLLRYPIFTAELSRVLPVLNVALGLNIFGHLAALAWNRYLLRQIIEVVLHAMGLAVAITFLKVFPFDYSGLPIEALAAILPRSPWSACAGHHRQRGGDSGSPRAFRHRPLGPMGKPPRAHASR
jgi:hypothetical protein